MKPGYQTTEFWLVIVANVLTQLGALDVPERYRWIVTAATLVGYAISRGLAKAGAPKTPAIAPAVEAIRRAADVLTGAAETKPPEQGVDPVPRQATP